METIVCSAIRKDGKIWTGLRHNNCILSYFEEAGKQFGGAERNQGFMTSLDRYVDRREGYRIAKAAGQLEGRKKNGSNQPILYSEDLW